MSSRSSRLAILTCAALLPVTAMAQEVDEVEKSAEQIQCELSDSCAQASDADTPLATESGTTAADDSEVTRSWTWGGAGAASPTQAASTRLVTPSAGISRPNRPAPESAKRRLRPAVAPTPGRSSLSIGFVSGSAAFTEVGLRQADKVFQALSAGDLSKKHYLIGGYTDAVGDPDLNLELSRRRAQALVDHLVAKGLPRDNFSVRGFGGTGAVRGATSNRRVEIVKLD